MDKKPLLFLVIVGLLFAMIFCRREKRSNSTSQNKSQVTDNVTTNSLSTADVSNAKSGGYTGEKIEVRDSVPTAPAIGAAYFKTDRGTFGVGIKMAPVVWCVKGDIDRIFAVQKAHGSSVLVTLEPVGVGDSAKAVVKELSESDLRNGRDLLFEVEPSGPSVFALMVCTDSSGSKRCLGKKPADMKIDFNYFVSNIPQGASRDLIFFTHLLTLDKNNFQVFQTTPVIQSIADTFAAAKGKKNLEKEELERAQYILEVINAGRPNPSTVVYDGGAGTPVNLNLSMQDEARCVRD